MCSIDDAHGPGTDSLENPVVVKGPADQTVVLGSDDDPPQARRVNWLGGPSFYRATRSPTHRHSGEFSTSAHVTEVPG
jgi:hypothetical protein